MTEKTRIYVIFPSSGLDHRGAWEPEDIKRKMMTNEEMLGELENRCTGVEFVGKVNLVDEERKDRISRAHYGTTEEERQYQAETNRIAEERRRVAIESVRTSLHELDGILIFGPPWDELIETGLPIIAVFPMWGTWMANFNFKAYKGKRILVGHLPVVRDASESIFSSRLDDIAGKIKLIQAISKMKDLRALVVTDRPVLGEFEPTSLQVRGDRERYEKVYLHNLKETFGTELVAIPQQEMVKRMKEADEGEARRIARKWIEEAEKINGTNEAEVVKSARLYLAMKELMEKYNCQAITTEGYGVFEEYSGGPIPSQGLPSSQFCTDGVVATSETLIDSLVTQQLGLTLTGSTGFNGDYLIDPFNGVAIIGHCECPFNPWGDDRRAPYIIRNLPRWSKNEGGACVQVNLPVDETVTVTRISMYDKKISLFTGKATSGRKFFKEWDNLGCRTKLAVETDTEALLRNVDWQTFGVHRVAFYGDHRRRFKDLAALMGFEVMEDDK